jgi:hypothetical protein
VLSAYVAHYDLARPHRGLNLEVPVPVWEVDPAGASEAAIERLDVLGGLIHQYRRAG